MPTRGGPTPVPGVKLAIACLKTSGGAKVNLCSSTTDTHEILHIYLNVFDVQLVVELHSTMFVDSVDSHPDIDECQSLSTCANGICLNSEGSYTCENCPTGYRVSYDGELCEGGLVPLNASAPTSGSDLSVGRFHCFPPRKMSNRLFGFMPDVDECVLPTTCPQGTCTNTEGSFTCTVCQPGFRVSDDGQQCDGEAFGCVLFVSFTHRCFSRRL